MNRCSRPDIRSAWWMPALAGLMIGGSPLAAQNACDTALVRLAAQNNGYRQRGNRCEGMYARQVGGTTLALVSFTEIFEPYAAGRDTMRVSWPSDVHDSIRIRAEFLRRGQYYRMDATQPGNGSFLWPSGLLNSQQLPGRNVGVLGWTRFTAAGTSTQLYQPLRVRTTATGALSCGDYTLMFWPGERLDSVFVTLAPLNAQGRPGQAVRDNQPLTSGPYPAEYPILVRIRRQEISQAGPHYLRFSARLENGSPATREYYLFLSPTCPR